MKLYKNGNIYLMCKSCPIEVEKFISENEILQKDGTMKNEHLNGVKWAIENGYSLVDLTKDSYKYLIETEILKESNYVKEFCKRWCKTNLDRTQLVFDISSINSQDEMFEVIKEISNNPKLNIHNIKFDIIKK